jgi:hypothetical protein
MPHLKWQEMNDWHLGNHHAWTLFNKVLEWGVPTGSF